MCMFQRYVSSVMWKQFWGGDFLEARLIKLGPICYQLGHVHL